MILCVEQDKVEDLLHDLEYRMNSMKLSEAKFKFDDLFKFKFLQDIFRCADRNP